MDYETVIGLEVHAQLTTKTKIFCGCRSHFGDEANTHGCPVCLGLPGALPVLNKKVVEMAIMMGRAVGCSIAEKSIFARKNYFYPDLPKGYQISQYELPLCEHGYLDIETNGDLKRIGITRIHLEEDAGKLIHDQDEDSLFDVNRCGTPLIEIVSEPDMRSPQEAYAYLMSLKQILQYLGICDCNMEEGSLRCDANVSIRPFGWKEFGVKTELKNMNSFRGVEKALEYEVFRQQSVLDSGGKIVQQTWLWDANQNKTVPMRDKEDAHDYRYFPDPDLVPLLVEKQWADQIHQELPELPQARKQRFQSHYRLNLEHATVLTDIKEVADYFEATAQSVKQPRTAANWVMGEVLRYANDKKVSVRDIKISPNSLARLINRIDDGTISGNAAKKVFAALEETGGEIDDIIEAEGLRQISDSSELEAVVQSIFDANPDEVVRFKSGEKKLMGFFVGQVMKATNGKGNPREINKIIGAKLC
ncbi:MAG: Asp-tRNA(Asn)/Glu-tRNA(Gln) amidotransferase subunit GatB [Chitinivibrionales bacterium]|nr:Asp-tRNA(Asn)/Glu-tRNA(Gln) amidotransferase subunit GatB [Chitinivibrionales bacterium]